MGSCRSSAVLVAGAALVVSVLSGCSGEGDPEADPTPILSESSEPADPSPSESEAAEPEAPEMPDAARERSFDGAEAFIEHWVDTFNYATVTGDTEPLAAISGAECAGCSAAMTQIDDLYDEGGRIESDGWDVTQVGFNNDGNLVTPDLAVRMDRSPQRFVQADQQTVERFPGGPASYLFSLSQSGTSWVADSVELLE